MSSYVVQCILWCAIGTAIGVLAGWLFAVLVAPYAKNSPALARVTRSRR